MIEQVTGWGGMVGQVSTPLTCLLALADDPRQVNRLCYVYASR